MSNIQYVNFSHSYIRGFLDSTQQCIADNDQFDNPRVNHWCYNNIGPFVLFNNPLDSNTVLLYPVFDCIA